MIDTLPTPHGDKLRALLANAKLPRTDKPRVSAAIERYASWLTEMEETKDSGEGFVIPLVESLNRYKNMMDLDLIFDSKKDFLYRQKGQLKLDNTVLEEFLPWLVSRVFSERLSNSNLHLGPGNAFAQLHFESSLLDILPGGGMVVRSKDHDFTIARSLFIKASHDHDYRQFKEANISLAYLAAEIKTNLDKTMFQEASATASDLKVALPNSRYFLLCEWLDMTPISAAVTAMEEVIILRKARRLGSDVRQHFSKASGRFAHRKIMEQHLEENPFAPAAFERFLWHVKQMLGEIDDSEHNVLDRGWF